MLRIRWSSIEAKPVGNFDEVFRQAFADAYAPFLAFLESRPALRLAFHHSGPLLQWLALHEAGYLGRLRALVERGQVELWGGGFFEPILPAIPEVDQADLVFAAERSLPTAFVPDIEYLVYVDEVAYHAWPYRDRQGVARLVGRITEALRGRRFALVGPGRWGSWNPQLGVPVTYAEIAGTLVDRILAEKVL